MNTFVIYTRQSASQTSRLNRQQLSETKVHGVSDSLGTVLDLPISQTEIKAAIKKLKSKKAPGVDRIRNEMLKCGADKLIPILFELFNLIVNSGIYPDIWTKGVITAIYKSGDSSNPSNYRGICVTNCLGKLFCFILNSRLHLFKNNNLLHNSQIGFLPGN